MHRVGFGSRTCFAFTIRMKLSVTSLFGSNISGRKQICILKIGGVWPEPRNAKEGWTRQAPSENDKQVGLELGQVNVKGAVKTEQGWRKWSGWSDDWDWRRWSRATDIEIATAIVYMENKIIKVWFELNSFHFLTISISVCIMPRDNLKSQFDQFFNINLPDTDFLFFEYSSKKAW